jgi:hypothetical protein
VDESAHPPPLSFRESASAADDQSATLQSGEKYFPFTPSFLINRKKLVGPPSFEILKATIDAILAGG